MVVEKRVGTQSAGLTRRDVSRSTDKQTWVVENIREKCRKRRLCYCVYNLRLSDGNTVVGGWWGRNTSLNFGRKQWVTHRQIFIRVHTHTHARTRPLTLTYNSYVCMDVRLVPVVCALRTRLTYLRAPIVDGLRLTFQPKRYCAGGRKRYASGGGKGRCRLYPFVIVAQ